MRAALAIVDAVARARSRGSHRHRVRRDRLGRDRDDLRDGTRDQRCRTPAAVGRSRARSCSAPASSGSPATWSSTTPLGAQAARGFPDGVEAWRVVSVSEEVGRRLIVSVPFVGREEELELLHNTFARAARDRRVHLVTVYGAAGRRQVATRAGVRRRRRALDHPRGALPSVRGGRHLLGGRRDGEGRGGDHRRRLRRRCSREAPAAAAATRRSPICSRSRPASSTRSAASGPPPRSPGPRRHGRRSSPTCSRSCSCSRTSTGPRSRCST